MANCRFCGADLEHTGEPITEANVIARHHGYCNGVCWGRMSGAELKHRARREDNPEARDYPAWCGLCGAYHGKRMTGDEYRAVLPLAPLREGRVNILCERCRALAESSEAQG